MTTTATTSSVPGDTSSLAPLAGPAQWVDDRLHPAGVLRRNMRKVFPDHWSFMLGEIALYSFIILLLTGTYLALFYDASIERVIYNGSYVPLRGIEMTQAYRSTLDISFDVRGGLLIRQIHHWAALLFVASISVHSMRIFFTGAYRKPRELNWVIGVGLLTLGLLEGFAGYSLPDDLLSGTGLRIAFSIVESIPVVGTYIAFFVFGGNFPGPEFIGRLYTVHILLMPGLLLALIGAHLMLVWTQKHTDFPGPGKTEHNVHGHPVYPTFAIKSQGFLFMVFGVVAALGAFVQINPIWLYGPYDPAQVSAGSQPDWYIGWLDGALRTMPGLESNFLGHTISWNLLIPAVVIPGIVFTGMALYPFLEQWFTKDKSHHNLLSRPRNAPVRTGIGVMSLTFYTLLWINGGNDIIARTFDLSINSITWFMRGAVILGPPIAFEVTRRICYALQRRDRDLLDHGEETGIIRRLPSGEFIEAHAPVEESRRPLLEAGLVRAPQELEQMMPDVDPDNGARRPGAGALNGVRRKLVGFFTDEDTEAEILAPHGEADGAHGAEAVASGERRALEESGQQ